jgi:hypothetical protein
MPSVSKAQQGFMGAELARKRAGKKTQTGMSEQQLSDFAGTSTKGLPAHKSPTRRGRKRGSVNYSSARKAKPGMKMRGYKVT